MRRRLISNWHFQITYAIAMVRGVIVGILIPGLAGLFTLYLMSQHSDLAATQKTALINGLNHLGVMLLWIILGMSVAFGLFGLIISQRLVGPLNRIETWSMQHLMNQDPGNLKIRKSDELSSVAETLNRIVHKSEEPEQK